MKKYQHLIIVLILLVVTITLQLLFKKERLTLFPNPKSMNLVPYSDSSLDTQNWGNSWVRVDSTNDNGVYYCYELHEQFEYYYAGLRLELKEKLDLCNFSHAKISVTCPDNEILRFFILTDEAGISKEDESTTWRHLRTMIPINKGKRKYTVKVIDLHTPQWWFNVSEISGEKVTDTPYKEVLGFKLESGEGEKVNVETPMILHSITFYTPIPLPVRIIQVVFLFLGLLFLAFHFGFIKRVQIGGYKPVILGNLYDEELELVTSFIGDNYQDKTFSLASMAKAVAMHEDKVAALIRRGYGQNFKQYLNRIRLTEAQRLLRSTDRQISEIAFAVGYNSVSHFNRVFKQFFDCTPREFRAK